MKTFIFINFCEELYVYFSYLKYELIYKNVII